MHSSHDTSTNDTKRLSALRGYGVLDSPNEVEFDRIVREAARALNTPMALISFIDENRQWFKARIGIEASETPLCISFCTHAIRGPDVLVVKNAKLDDRFALNPLVTGEPHIRFYAGAPLVTHAGIRIGTLCVVDNRPRSDFTEADVLRITALADRTMKALERRKTRLAT